MVKIPYFDDPPAEPILFSIAEAAARLGLGKTKLFELLADGELESITIGRRRLIPRTALDEFVDRLRTRAAS